MFVYPSFQQWRWTNRTTFSSNFFFCHFFFFYFSIQNHEVTCVFWTNQNKKYVKTDIKWANNELCLTGKRNDTQFLKVRIFTEAQFCNRFSTIWYFFFSLSTHFATKVYLREEGFMLGSWEFYFRGRGPHRKMRRIQVTQWLMYLNFISSWAEAVNETTAISPVLIKII